MLMKSGHVIEDVIPNQQKKTQPMEYGTRSLGSAGGNRKAAAQLEKASIDQLMFASQHRNDRMFSGKENGLTQMPKEVDSCWKLMTVSVSPTGNESLTPSSKRLWLALE